MPEPWLQSSQHFPTNASLMALCLQPIFSINGSDSETKSSSGQNNKPGYLLPILLIFRNIENLFTPQVPYCPTKMLVSWPSLCIMRSKSLINCGSVKRDIFPKPVLKSPKSSKSPYSNPENLSSSLAFLQLVYRESNTSNS